MLVFMSTPKVDFFNNLLYNALCKGGTVMTIGERIKNRRIQLGLTQTQLAHKMGITSKTTICKAETTDFNPTMDRVRDFADALDVSPAYLMGWVTEPNPNNEDTKVTSSKEYYVNEEAAKVAQSLFENEDMRILFDAAKDSKPEDLKMAADFLRRLKATNSEG